jgi:protein-S-isoprenylcysteine O-methyltransferase
MIIIGLLIVISGEYLRKLAMYTARQSFSHLIEDKPNRDHRLITNGIYEYYRHPSYVGWFWWACGTQVILANPICFLLYLIVKKFSRKGIVYFYYLFRQLGCFLPIESFMKNRH